MDSVLRGAATYFMVWLVFRLAGKRSLAQITTFDVVLLLIISETTQASLIDEDNSMTNTFLLILTLLGTDVFLSVLKHRIPFFQRLIDGLPLVLVEKGERREEHMDKERVDKDDILQSARELLGLKSFDEIEYAVLEPSGGITIVPKRKPAKSQAAEPDSEG